MSLSKLKNWKEKAIQLSAIESRQKQQKKIMYLEQLQYIISAFTTVSLLIILGSVIGILIGINVPNGAACHRKNLPCRWFRLREPTTIISLFDNDIFQQSLTLSE